MEKDIELFNGDCLDVLDKLEPNSVDFILCDLPYGTTSAKWDKQIPLDILWQKYRRVLKDTGIVALFGREPFSSYLRLSNIKEYRYDWYWKKSKVGNFLSGNKTPLRNIETISIFYKKCFYNPQKTINPIGMSKRNKYAFTSMISENFEGTNCFSKPKILKTSDSYEPNKLLPKCLIEFKSISKPIHPTQKPVELLEYLIKTYTNENYIVLDNTMGSGSTGVACINTNRKFIGIEIEKKYYNIARERVEKTIEEKQK